MGWFGRSIGDFGSQVGQGYDINLGWRERLQQIALQNARQKLADVMGPLQVQEIQQRLKQMQQPQFHGTVPLPGGGTGAVTFDPTTGKPSMSPLVPSSMTPDAVGRQILNGRQSLAPNDQPFADQLLGELRMGADPSKVLDKWMQFFSGASKAQKQKPPTVNVDKGLVTIYDAFGNGSDYPIYDAKGNINPELPADVKPLVASQVSAFDIKEKQKQTDAEAASQRVLDRQEAAQNRRDKTAGQKQKETDATKAVTIAINAFNRYQSEAAAEQKVGMASHWYFPSTWGQPAIAGTRTQEAKQDAEGKRLDAIQQLKDAGMSVPQWLTKAIGPQSQAPPAMPPPPGPPVPGAQIRAVP